MGRRVNIAKDAAEAEAKCNAIIPALSAAYDDRLPGCSEAERGEAAVLCMTLKRHGYTIVPRRAQ